jgi:hypothetical protein
VDVIRDCTDNGRIDDYYGPQDYQQALDNLPSDVDEYTDCRQLIVAASHRTPPSHSSGGGGGGSSSSSSSGGSSGGSHTGSGGAKAAAAKPKPKPQPQGPPVIPSDSTLASHPLGHGIPIPLLVTLILLGLALVAGLLVGARARGVGLPVPVVRVVDRVFPRRA